MKIEINEKERVLILMCECEEHTRIFDLEELKEIMKRLTSCYLCSGETEEDELTWIGIDEPENKHWVCERCMDRGG